MALSMMPRMNDATVQRDGFLTPSFIVNGF